RASMPELPAAKRQRFVETLGLTPYAAHVLTTHPGVTSFFEEAARLYEADSTRVANFIQSEVLRDVQTHGLDAKIPVSARQSADLLALVDGGTISGKQAKEVYAAMTGTPQSPAEVVAKLGMQQVSDAGELEAICKKIVEQNAKQAEQLRAGKTAL